MYHIYHTDAVVLFYRNYGEADKLFTLYTRELGLITARAQGVRKLESKTRYGLTLFSHVQIDLVRGRDMWRLASARPIDGFARLSRDATTLRLMAKLSRLTKRLCAGEGSEVRIIDDLVALLHYFDRDDITAEERKVAELTYALRLLHFLGYIGENDSFADILKDDVSFGTLGASNKTLIFEINRALRESQL